MSEFEKGQPIFSAEFIETKKAEKYLLKRYTTVLFEDEAEWAHFLEWVYDTFGGPAGLRFSNSPVPMTIRVSPSLLELAIGEFPKMRQVTPVDEQRHLATLKGTHPFDPEYLRGGHIEGLDYFRGRRKE